MAEENNETTQSAPAATPSKALYLERTGVRQYVARNARGAEVLVHDPMYTDEELAKYGFTPYHLGDPVGAAILQADHPEYLELAPSDLPGIAVIVDGRGALDPARWEGVAYRSIGDGTAR